MGFQSRRFRVSETVDSELVHLYLFLFLCLVFLSRPADYGHTMPRVYRGALNLEQGPSEIVAAANPGAFNVEQGTSEVIVNVTNHSANYNFGSFGENSSIEAYYSDFSRGTKLASRLHVRPLSLTLPSNFTAMSNNHWHGMDLSKNQFQGTLPNLTFVTPFSSLHYGEAVEDRATCSAFDSDFDTLDETILWIRGYIDLQIRVLSQWYLSSGETAIGIISFKRKLYHVDEFSNGTVVKYYDRELIPLKTLYEWAKVISIILAGIIIFLIILTMAWKRIRNVILFKSNNELDAIILEASDLDESYLADRILYENLLKEAELVSEGSSGKVFKVRFLELECAMKVFHSNATMDFRKESITLLNLNHPHVVKLFCSFRKSFIIMELMDEDLYSFITKIRERRIDYDMPLEVALDVMLQIAEGMSYLHHQGIAHQDLKSLNILLKLRGEFDDPDFQIIAKVADFGSARRFDPRYPTSFVLFPNMNIGTRSWRAPELFHPSGSFWTRFFGLNPRVLSKPLDIYGFAVICSELLTKQVPFSNDEGLRLAVLASKLRQGHRPALPSTGCPEGLLALIKDCWHRDPVLRPEFHEVCTRLVEVKSSWMSRGQSSES